MGSYIACLFTSGAHPLTTLASSEKAEAFARAYRRGAAPVAQLRLGHARLAARTLGQIARISPVVELLTSKNTLMILA